jgi:hypothetical protein
MLGPFFVVSGFIITGIAFTFFAPHIQRYAIWSIERWPPIFKSCPPRKHIESRFYVWELRAIGVVALSVGLYGLFDLIKRL